ncbi:hypothetical protein KP509_04G029700 [Ceratopteris richardii]|uniref:Uncharacterized protein n=1 Tax=Ceratopteris richardii TaxID=49495 RepID=A0A8T2URH6_CERRI|nr:hypothetical protein KP509_04G029700 [Ceratopteris richardii]
MGTVERSDSRHRGERMTACEMRRGTWTPEEDELLMAYVEKHGASAWNMAPFYYPELRRTGKSCRLRYTNQLRPGIRRHPVSPEELLLILRLHSQYGNQWSKIASMVPGRTDNSVKNIVNMHLKKARRRAATLGLARAAAAAAAQLLLPSSTQPVCVGPSSTSVSDAVETPSQLFPFSSHGLQALAGVNSLHTCGGWDATSSQLPSVRKCQSSSLSPELPSVQHPENLRGFLGSISESNPHSPSPGDDMLELSGSGSSLVNHADDKDLIEALYASGYMNPMKSTDGTNKPSNDCFSANRIENDTDAMNCSVNAISMTRDCELFSENSSAHVDECMKQLYASAQGWENTFECVRAIGTLNQEAIRNMELVNLIAGFEWVNMPSLQ